jgi:hypothetical protein
MEKTAKALLNPREVRRRLEVLCTRRQGPPARKQWEDL